MTTDIEKQIAELEQEILQGGLRLPESKDTDLQSRLRTLQSIIDVHNMMSAEELVIDLKSELENRMELPDPSELDDEQLTEKLHAVIDLLAQFHFKLDFTNHLDDRELYQAILTHILEDPIYINENPKGTLIHHDASSYDLDAPEDFFDDDSQSLKVDRDDMLDELAEKYLYSPLPKITKNLGRVPAL